MMASKKKRAAKKLAPRATVEMTSHWPLAKRTLPKGKGLEFGDLGMVLRPDIATVEEKVEFSVRGLLNQVETGRVQKLAVFRWSDELKQWHLTLEGDPKPTMAEVAELAKGYAEAKIWCSGSGKVGLF